MIVFEGEPIPLGATITGSGKCYGDWEWWEFVIYPGTHPEPPLYVSSGCSEANNADVDLLSALLRALMAKEGG